MRVYRLDGPLSNRRLLQLMEREMFPSPCLDYSRHCWRDGHGERDLYRGHGVKFYFRSYKMALQYLVMLREEHARTKDAIEIAGGDDDGDLDGFLGYELTRHYVRGKDIVYIDDWQIAEARGE